MVSLFPHQPLYTSIIPTSNNAQPGTVDNSKSNSNIQSASQSQSIQNLINQISKTDGGPDNLSNSQNMNIATTPTMNIVKTPIMSGTDLMNQQFLAQQQILQQQQLIQQQAIQLQQQQIAAQQQQQQQGNKTNAWINANFAKPVLSGNGNATSSSPILHSIHNSPMGQQPASKQSVLTYLNNGNNMNLSGGSDTFNNAEPGNPSKSKIFEHKKALRNVSPETEAKLMELHELGFKNRTFNLVLLKQEKGDMKKVVDNLKQFYQDN